MQKAIRISAIIVIVGFLAALVVFNILNPPRPDMSVWNEKMSKGNAETAKHHYIMYTDIFCPYCDKFSDAIGANLEDFDKNYIEDKNILFEIRVTDLNYLNGHSQNSKPAGLAAYCAASQGNFWDYYYALLKKIYDDYHSKGIGVDPTSQKIPTLENSYFVEAAAGIESLDSEKLKSCIENEETLAELDKNTAEAQKKGVTGVPYFLFDKFKYNGFMGTWNTDSDYKVAKDMLDAGLTAK